MSKAVSKNLNIVNGPGYRNNFGLCNVGSTVYIFGGYTGKVRLGDLWELNLHPTKAMIISCNKVKFLYSKYPEPVCGCSLNAYNNDLYLFGGRNNHKNFVNNLWKYSINQKKWKKFNINVINGMYCHNTVVYKHYLIIFGGKSFQNGSPIVYNNIYSFNMKTNKTKMIKTLNTPSPRALCGMGIIKDETLIVFGGENAKESAYNDAYMIMAHDLINKDYPMWTKININMHGINRYLAVFNNTDIICFGGFDTKSSMRSNKLVVFKDIKDPTKLMEYKLNDMIMKSIERRCWHNGCLLTINGKEYLFVFGGFGQTYKNDCHIIEMYPDQKQRNIMEEKALESKENSEGNIKILYKLFSESISPALIQNIFNASQKNLLVCIDILNEFKKEKDKHDDQITALTNEITQLKGQLNEIKLQQNDDDIKQDISNDDSKEGLSMEETNFKLFFNKHFFGYKSQTQIKYYQNIVDNECDNIDIFITLTKEILSQNIKIKPIHLHSFHNKLLELKDARQIWKEYLKGIHQTHHDITLTKFGIYTFGEFYDKIKCIYDVELIINNKEDAITIFNNTPRAKNSIIQINDVSMNNNNNNQNSENNEGKNQNVITLLGLVNENQNIFD